MSIIANKCNIKFDFFITHTLQLIFIILSLSIYPKNKYYKGGGFVTIQKQFWVSGISCGKCVCFLQIGSFNTNSSKNRFIKWFVDSFVVPYILALDILHSLKRSNIRVSIVD